MADQSLTEEYHNTKGDRYVPQTVDFANMGSVKAYYGELFLLLHILAFMCCFPLTRRPNILKPLAVLSTGCCFVMCLTALPVLCLFFWSATFPYPGDLPGVNVIRMNGCLFGVIQYGSMLFLFVFGTTKAGLDEFIRSLKVIRDLNKSRFGKEPRVKLCIVKLVAVVHFFYIYFGFLLIVGGIIHTGYSDFYHQVYAPFLKDTMTYYTYFFAVFPVSMSMIGAWVITPFIFGITMILVRREIDVFCANLTQQRSISFGSHFIDKLRQDYEAMLQLIDMTSRIWSPYYGMVTFCNLASAVFLAFNAFYPELDGMSFVNFIQAILGVFVLTSLAIFMNSGVSANAWLSVLLFVRFHLFHTKAVRSSQ